MALKLSFKSFLVPRDLGWNRTRAVCALPDCHNKLLMRYVPGSRIGIHVGEAWYCSPDCFALGSRRTLSSLAAEHVVEMPRHPRLTLGLALLAKGFLSEEQLRFAAARSQAQGIGLEATLIEHGLAGEKQLASARAAQWGYPALALDLAGHVVEADLPPALLRDFTAVPIHYSVKAKRLVLGFVHRVEHRFLQAIEQITGFRAEPCFITPAEFLEQMERVRAVSGYEEVVVENPGNAIQMGRTLGGLAVEHGASEAAFTRCKSWIWARMIAKRGAVDVVLALKNAPVTHAADFSNPIPQLTGALG